MTVVNEWVAGTRFGGWVQRCRESRRLVLVIVAIALLLDNLLLTTVGKEDIRLFLLMLVFVVVSKHLEIQIYYYFLSSLQLQR